MNNLGLLLSGDEPDAARLWFVRAADVVTPRPAKTWLACRPPRRLRNSDRQDVVVAAAARHP